MALAYAVMFAVSVGLTTWGTAALERSSEALARHYTLPAVVRGSLVVAIGSSFPDLTTAAVAAVVHGEFELGVASIVGSAVFNILVIPGIAGTVAGVLRYDLTLVYRDAQFYLTSVAVLVLTFAFAVLYAPVEGERLVGNLTRPLVLIPLGTYLVYLFLQQQETAEARAARRAGPAPSRGGTSPTMSRSRAWMVLGFGLVLVVAGVEGLLRTAIWLGEVLGTPSFLWGATVVAATTSLPDAIISVRAARAGEGDVSIGNVLGSNVFDLLVAIPVVVLIVGAAPIDLRVAAPLMGFLTLATIALFAALRTEVSLSRREAVALLGLYAVFILWLGLETGGVTRLLG